MTAARQKAHREARSASIASIAARLQDMLGQRLTAYAVGLKDPKTIGRYARGDNPPRDEKDERLRNLFEVTQVLLHKETPETVRAWMVGAHPLLEDQAPIELLHSDIRPPVERTAATDSGLSERAGFLSVVNLAEEFAQAA